MKIYRLGAYFLFAVWLLGLVPTPGSTSSEVSQLNVLPALAAPLPLVGPSLTIPDEIIAIANSTVIIPVQFDSGGYDIASVAFSVDYSNTWLSFDPTHPLSITFGLPPGFGGSCTFDASDTDGEIDCFIVDPLPPITALPDGTIVASIRLSTGAPPNGTVAAIGFSTDPLTTYGDTEGGFVSGSTFGGSVLFVAPPNPPSSLVASLYSCSVYLSWQDNSTNEDGFKIERRTGFLPYAEIATVLSGTNTYLDSGLSPATNYIYRVRAYNVGGYSTYTNEAPVITDAICNYPVFLPLVAVESGSTYAIFGTVRNSGGIPMPNVLVCSGLDCLYTNGSGDYMLGNLSAGAYILEASTPGYICTPNFSNPVTVPPTATLKDFTCTSATGNYIAGMVEDNLGTPLADVVIADPLKSNNTYTNSSGYYLLDNLDPSSYNLIAYKAGYTCVAQFPMPLSVPPSATGKNFVCTPNACSSMIVNPGFEASVGWEIPITEYTAGYSTLISRTGLRSMRTGIVNPYDNRYSYSSARQLVTIPSTATQAILRFFRFPISGELILGATANQADLAKLPAFGEAFELAPLSSDIQMVLILDPWDNILSTLMWGLSNSQTWQYKQFSLYAFRGWTIKIYFGTYNDGWGGASSQFIDNVSLDVCP